MSFAPRTFTTGMRCVPHGETNANTDFLSRMQLCVASQPWPRGAIQSRGQLGCRTASGIRTQQVEIKYKKPTVHCGKNAPKMIHCDSFEEKFERAAWPCCRVRGGNAPKLNRSESLQAFRRRARHATAAQRGHAACHSGRGAGGYQISTTFWGRYRTGLTQSFFLVAGGLNYFPEIKHFKRGPQPRRSCGMSIFKGLPCLPPRRWLDWRRRRSIYFLAPCRPRGVVILWALAGPGPRGSAAHFAAKFRESFFWPGFPRSPLKKTPRNSGWGGWS